VGGSDVDAGFDADAGLDADSGLDAGAGAGLRRQARKPPARLLFVCLGNICRSPTAEGVMRALVSREGLERNIELDSAGTGAWHVGSSPDRRATEAARARGVTLEGRARQVRPEDFDDFDLLLAMDRKNLRELCRQVPGERQRAKLRLLREFDPASAPREDGGSGEAGSDVSDRSDLDVPDPYYGAAGGFDEVFELVQAACEGLLAQIRDGFPIRPAS
jgi:protein-tyrosine phosphatase